MGIFGNLFKPQPPSEEEEKKSSAVLDNLRKRRGAETGKWLSLMMRDAENIPVPGPVSTPEGVDKRPVIKEAPYSPPVKAQYMTMSMPAVDVSLANEALPKSQTVEWINRLFAEFAIQSAAFNSSAQGTHLIVTVHAPEFEMEKPIPGEYTPEKKIAAFKGHLATLQWGMLVQGYQDKIDIYVVPSDKILNFMLHDIRKSSYAPFMTIDSTGIESKQEWHIAGSVITFDTIPLLAKELLGDLVRVASGSMDETELFGAHEKGLRLGETVGKGYEAPGGGAGAMGNAQGFGSLERLETWNAASAFLTAMDQDVPWLIQQKADMVTANKQDEAARLADLTTRMRTLSGEIGALLADFHPAQGSKYNAS